MADNEARTYKPALLSVDDDAAVARAVQRDLRRRYAERYQVLSAGGGEAALDLVRQATLRGQPVALLLADQRMPGLSGVDFLEQAIDLAPSAKRVLLTAYADTQAAIKAINEIHLDHYLLKPWDPPEDNLYPVLDDLLADWQADHVLEAARVRVVGHRFSVETHALRDFLSRNQVPYAWLDVERDPEAQRLLTAAGVSGDGVRLPVVVLPEGEALETPDTTTLATAVGLTTQVELDHYDLVIVGAGPAGLAGAVYGASEGLTTVLVEREAPGGQAGTSSRIENYLGFPVGLSGADLTRRARDQAERFGARVVSVQEVSGVEARGPARLVHLASGDEISANAIIVATGVSYRQLDAPGVRELTGRGVYYGAARTEAVACEGEQVFVVGGANSAGQAALFLATRAGKVTVLYRGESLTRSMSHYLVERIEAHERIEVRTGTNIAEAHGDDRLEELTLDTGERLPAASVFIFIGAQPHTDWLEGVVARDERGFVLTGPDLRMLRDGQPHWPLEDREPLLLETSLPGVFAAGDVRHQSIKRVASAVGDGAMAVQFVHQYLGTLP